MEAELSFHVMVAKNHSQKKKIKPQTPIVTSQDNIGFTKTVTTPGLSKILAWKGTGDEHSCPLIYLWTWDATRLTTTVPAYTSWLHYLDLC